MAFQPIAREVAACPVFMSAMIQCPLISVAFDKFDKVLILLECTELPPYADALRAAFRLPVFDAITCADFFISAFKDNPRFGMNEWQLPWDGEQDDYEYGANLTDAQKAKMHSVRRVHGCRAHRTQAVCRLQLCPRRSTV